MKTRFIFLRHAASVAKEKGIVQGTGRDIPLSESGRREASQLGDAFPFDTIDRIYASPAVRTRDTAKPLRDRFPDTPYEELESLLERSKGEAEGMTAEEFERSYPDIVAAWSREEDPRVADGESYADVERRALPVLESHLASHEGETILYVGHGNVFRVLLGAMLGIPHGMRNRIELGCCSVSVADYDHERSRWSIIEINRRILPSS